MLTLKMGDRQLSFTQGRQVVFFLSAMENYAPSEARSCKASLLKPVDIIGRPVGGQWELT